MAVTLWPSRFLVAKAARQGRGEPKDIRNEQDASEAVHDEDFLRQGAQRNPLRRPPEGKSRCGIRGPCYTAACWVERGASSMPAAPIFHPRMPATMPPAMQRTVAVIALASIVLLFSTAAQAQGRWVKLAPFPEPSEELYGMAANGKLYVFGGLAPGYSPKALVYEYDPATDKWAKKKPMALASHHVALTEYRGKIYLFGGFVLPASRHGSPSATCGNTIPPPIRGKRLRLCRPSGAQRARRKWAAKFT